MEACGLGVGGTGERRMKNCSRLARTICRVSMMIVRCKELIFTQVISCEGWESARPWSLSIF